MCPSVACEGGLSENASQAKHVFRDGGAWPGEYKLVGVGFRYAPCPEAPAPLEQSHRPPGSTSSVQPPIYNV